MVAIPAVVAYNIFQGRVRRTLGRVDAMAHLILARSHEENKAEAAGSSSKGA
jgi:biopolymer transport protein ExbB/TolQ